MTSKKHHFVPQMLLRRFADDQEHLTVHRLAQGVQHPAAVRDLGHRNGGHTLYFPGREPDHDALEQRMSDLEGAASRVIDRLSLGTTTRIDGEERDVLAWFLALQWSRHRHLLAAVRQAVKPAPDKMTPEVEEWMKSGGLMNVDILLDAWAMRDDPHAAPKDVYNGVVVALLGRFTWRLVRYRRPSLIVSDTTLCISGVADGETTDYPLAWANHGAGVGLGSCRRVTAALTPRLGLLLETGREPRHMPAARFNQFSIYNSREFVAHAPGWPDTEPRLFEGVLKDLQLQRMLAPAFGPTS